MTLVVGIVAGEPSGDLLGAGLMNALRSQRPDAHFVGVGGPRMRAAGLDAMFDGDALGINGFIDPVKRLPHLLHVMRALRRRFFRDPPDVFIGVDFNVFNLLIERSLKRRGVRTVHYVSPSVYAWRRGRIRRIGRAADLVLALYPFEPPLYADYDVKAVFVGHPLADEIAPDDQRHAARAALGLGDSERVVALLPGSRRSEVEQMGDLLLDAAALIAARLGPTVFVVPCPSAPLAAAMTARVAARTALDVRVHAGHARLPLAAADAAIVKSGTGTLEAMLLGTPMVVTYRLNRISYHIVRALMYGQFVAMPNVLAGRELVPELLQDAATPSALADALIAQLSASGARADVRAEFRRLHRALRCDGSARAAEAVLALLPAPGPHAMRG